MKHNQVKSSHGGARPGAGRKRGEPNKVNRDLRELAQHYTPEALDTLASIMRDGESEAARVSAANSILDRGYGKPAQHVTSEGTLKVTDERRRTATDYLAELAVAADNAGGPPVVH